MRFRVKLKTTVTAWVDVEVNERVYSALTAADLREIAADDGVQVEAGQFREFLAMAQEHAPGGMDVEHGPIELAHEELDESVEVVA